MSFSHNLTQHHQTTRKTYAVNSVSFNRKKRTSAVVLLKWMTGLFILTYGHKAVMTVCLTSVISLQTQREKRELALMERTDSEVAAG